MKTHCSICGEPVQVTWSNWKNSHYQTYHLEYAVWLKNWFRRFVLIMAPLSIVWLLFFIWWLSWYPSTLDIRPFFIAVPFYIVPIIILLTTQDRGIERFRTKWKEKQTNLL